MNVNLDRIRFFSIGSILNMVIEDYPQTFFHHDLRYVNLTSDEIYRIKIFQEMLY